MAEPNLAELILERKGDRTFEQLSADCGGEPAGRRLQQLSRHAVLRNFPDPGTITALAAGLSVPPVEVIMAAARSLGIPVDAGDDDVVLPGAGRLTPGSRRMVADLAQHLLSMESGAS